MTTIPSRPSTNKPAKQPVPHEQLPAFSKDSDIKYTLKMPGLDIAFLLEPYNGGFYSSKELKEFTLNYDPSRFWRGSLIRRALGTQELSYTLKDVRCFSSSHLLGVGDTFEIYLRHPEDIDRTSDKGPLMMVNRDNGHVLFYPSGYNADSFAIGTIAKNILTETQQSLGKKFSGAWEKIHNSNS